MTTRATVGTVAPTLCSFNVVKTSSPHAPPRNDPAMTALGTALFDQNAVDF
jgi:hypothetical protein